MKPVLQIGSVVVLVAVMFSPFPPFDRLGLTKRRGKGVESESSGYKGTLLIWKAKESHCPAQKGKTEGRKE
jgi:hypothetical protein